MSSEEIDTQNSENSKNGASSFDHDFTKMQLESSSSEEESSDNELYPTCLSMGISIPRKWSFDAHRMLKSTVRSDIFRWVDHSATGPFDGSIELILEIFDYSFR